MEDFKRGDIVQLITDTAWHQKGELAIVIDVGFECLNVNYETKDDFCLTSKKYFRKVNFDALYERLR